MYEGDDSNLCSQNYTDGRVLKTEYLEIENQWSEMHFYFYFRATLGVKEVLQSSKNST